MGERSELSVSELELKIYELTLQLHQQRQTETGEPVPGYDFDTLDGRVSLDELFGDRDQLLAIHNMGQGCRYCTIWGDGINGFLPHLESRVAVVMLSKDSPETQRTFANSRQWRFRMASHGGGDYIREQTVMEGQDNFPGIVCYERRDGIIYRRGASPFGPGDLYCSLWNLLGLAGIPGEEFTPQFNYWQRPEQLDDGGAGVL